MALIYRYGRIQTKEMVELFKYPVYLGIMVFSFGIKWNIEWGI